MVSSLELIVNSSTIGDWSAKYSVVSSAYNLRDNNGPSRDPCGTPVLTVLQFEYSGTTSGTTDAKQQ